ncbi:TetR/AcrR family transcriptional regulator [Leucobacter luti]|uniref:TetR/AcrR family transcriptional regulator n=1 Tax=Leucobacter luti TaxID=340320 RepID=UPI001AACDC5B|nr:TetR/AcrR family transcriptional regulator [Leucobacter luti]
MDIRSVIIERASEQLSRDGEISTRAVCEAAGVTQPVLYRLFGDKAGLLAAVVDAVWDDYLSAKRAAADSDDPLTDLTAGWHSHVAFALEHPHAYQLLFGTSLTTRPEASTEAMRLLQHKLERLAEQGRLSISPVDAARIVMAANTGLSLALLLRPEAYPDPAVSEATRSAVYASLLVSEHPDPAPASAQAIAATTLRAAIAASARPAAFSAAELLLLDEWLARFQTPPTSDTHPHDTHLKDA